MTRASWDEAMLIFGAAFNPDMLWRNRNTHAEVRLLTVETSGGAFRVRHSGNVHETLGQPVQLFLRFWEPVMR